MEHVEAVARAPESQVTGAVALASAVFAGSLAIDWPALPAGIRLAELLFVPVAMAACLGFRLRRPVVTRLDVLVLAYVAGALPSLLTTDDRTQSVVELGRHVYLAGLYSAVANLASRGYAGAMARGLAVGGVILAGLGLGFAGAYLARPFHLPAVGEVMTMPYLGDVLRLRALTYSPAMLGSVLTLAGAFSLAAALRTEEDTRRRRWILATAAIAGAAMLAFSPTMAGLLVALLIVTWPSWAAHPRSRMLGVTLVVLFVALVNFTVTASVRAVSIGGAPAAIADETRYAYAMEASSLTVGSIRVDYEVMSYFRVKEIAWEAFTAHPWTGLGLDRFHVATEAAYQHGRLTPLYRAIDPHSSLLGRLAETGVLGGLTLIALWIVMLRQGVIAVKTSARHDTWVARGALAACVGLLVNGINVDIMNFRFLWLVAGLLGGLSLAGARR